MKVKFAYLEREYQYFKIEIDNAIKECFESGSYILRDQVVRFEELTSKLHNGLSCIGVNSGTDALHIIMKMANLKVGSEIIVSAHSFVSSISSIINLGLVPVFCDIEIDGNIDLDKIYEHISDRTSGILVTHMNGLMVDMDKLANIASKNNLLIFEDAAQAIGSMSNSLPPGHHSFAAAYSLHPLKTLSVAGDGGIIVTRHPDIAERARAYRNLGQIEKGKYAINGINSRLDNIHAAIANVKILQLQKLLKNRNAVASFYNRELSNVKQIITPVSNHLNSYDISYSNYVILAQNRDELRKYLIESGIEVMVHWDPAVIDLDWCKEYLINGKQYNKTRYYIKNCISLPISPWLKNEEIQYVVDTIKKFYSR